MMRTMRTAQSNSLMKISHAMTKSTEHQVVHCQIDCLIIICDFQIQILILFALIMPVLYIFLMDWQKSKKQKKDKDDADGISFIFRKPQQITLAAVPSANQNDFCDGENMAYNVSSSPDNPHVQQPYFLKGKGFDCALMDHLMLFKLTDKFHRINMTGQTIGDDLLQLDKNTVFVLAADYAFYGSLRAIIDGIRNKFRRNIQIIVYDLGGLASHQDSHRELLGICNLSLRPFNFSLLPPEVHGLKIFAWKVAILAEMFTEFPSFIYLDTSIHFHSADYHLFFKGINGGMLSDFQFPMGTHHGLKFSTHPEMFTYIPLDPMLVRNFGNNDDIEMKEANMIIVRRSEFTRQLLKWSLLCALTRDCIEPKGARISCQFYDTDQLAIDGQCHRQDQSAMNILLYNMEYGMVRQGSLFTPHFRYNHPSNWGNRHSLQRGQRIQGDIAAKYGC